MKLILALLVFAGLLFASSIPCPLDDSPAIWTGVSRADSGSGKQVYEHRCLRGHTFWSLIA